MFGVNTRNRRALKTSNNAETDCKSKQFATKTTKKKEETLARSRVKKNVEQNENALPSSKKVEKTAKNKKSQPVLSVIAPKKINLSKNPVLNLKSPVLKDSTNTGNKNTAKVIGVNKTNVKKSSEITSESQCSEISSFENNKKCSVEDIENILNDITSSEKVIDDKKITKETKVHDKQVKVSEFTKTNKQNSIKSNTTKRNISIKEVESLLLDDNEEVNTDEDLKNIKNSKKTSEDADSSDNESTVKKSVEPVKRNLRNKANKNYCELSVLSQSSNSSIKQKSINKVDEKSEDNGKSNLPIYNKVLRLSQEQVKDKEEIYEFPDETLNDKQKRKKKKKVVKKSVTKRPKKAAVISNKKAVIISNKKLEGSKRINLMATPNIPKTITSQLKLFGPKNAITSEPTSSYNNMMNHSLIREPMSPINKVINDDYDLGSPWRPDAFTCINKVVQSTPQIVKPLFKPREKKKSLPTHSSKNSIFSADTILISNKENDKKQLSSGKKNQIDETANSSGSDDEETEKIITDNTKINENFELKKKELLKNAASFSDTFDLMTDENNLESTIPDEVPLFVDLQPTHFSMPPKRSYNKRKRVQFFNSYNDSEEESDDEVKQKIQKTKKKKENLNKEEKKRMQDWVKSINETFEEIEHFDLVVE